MHKFKVMEYACGLSVLIVGLGLYSFYVRELLASLALFTGACFLLALAAFAVFLLGLAALSTIRSAGNATRNTIAFSRRLIAAYSKP